MRRPLFGMSGMCISYKVKVPNTVTVGTVE